MSLNWSSIHLQFVVLCMYCLSCCQSSQFPSCTSLTLTVTNSQHAGGSVYFETHCTFLGFVANGVFPTTMCPWWKGGCVCLCHRGEKKSTEGSCTCVAWWLSLDSALHITASAWMSDLTEVTSMLHHPHKTHMHAPAWTDSITHKLLAYI